MSPQQERFEIRKASLRRASLLGCVERQGRDKNRHQIFREFRGLVRSPAVVLLVAGQNV
uniref:Uncharacterized protein n=1 Tax=Theropithecus gelada TaxID=9565 RepID=A0A8D2FM04_THEGE